MFLEFPTALRPAAMLLALAFPLAAVGDDGGASSPFDPPAQAALVAEALARHPALASAGAMTEAAAQRVSPASTIPDPMLSVSYQAEEGMPRLGQGEMSWLSVMGSQMIPTAGKRRLARDVAASGVGSAIADRERMELELAAEIRREVAMAAVARATRAALAEQQELWIGAVETARTMYETGGGSQADLVRMQAEAARIEEMILREEADEAATLARLRGLLAREPGAAVEIPSLDELVGRLGAELPADLADRGLAKSPEIAAAEAEVERARAATALARAERFPDLTASAGWMDRGSMPGMFTVGLGASLPIFSGKRQKPMIAEAEAMERVAAARLEAARLAVRANFERNLALLAAARRQVAAFRDGILVADRVAADSTLAAFRSGRAPFQSVFSSYETLLDDTRDSYARVGRALWHAANLVELAAGSPAPPWP